MSTSDPLDELESLFKSRRLHVERVEHTFNIQQEKGVQARKAHIDPRPLQEVLSSDPQRAMRQRAGFVNGVKHVLLEPSRSSADEWDFVESAGRIVPAIQTDTFGLGVEQAIDDRPWAIDFVDDLQVVYFLQLDRGLRVLTTTQVERWNVSDDRITSAARSLLFHKTRNLDFQSFNDTQAVTQLRGGDDLDAARCLVVADAFYAEVDDQFRFALPSSEHFLCVHRADSEAVKELQQSAQQVYSEATVPLTTRLFRFETGTPVALEDTSQ